MESLDGHELQEKSVETTTHEIFYLSHGRILIEESGVKAAIVILVH